MWLGPRDKILQEHPMGTKEIVPRKPTAKQIASAIKKRERGLRREEHERERANRKAERDATGVRGNDKRQRLHPSCPSRNIKGTVRRKAK